MTSVALLVDVFGRVRDLARRVVEGLSEEELATRPNDRTNTIAWLVWHLTRIQDSHVAALAETEEVWASLGWADRFGLPFDRAATGYGHGPDEVARVRPSGALLVGYHDAVYERTIGFVRSLRDGDLDRIVDESWDPPVSLGVRLVSVLSDDLQHVGQSAYVRGLIRSR